MFFRSFQARAFLVRLQVRVDELDEAVEVFCCDLAGMRQYILLGMRTMGVRLDSQSRFAGRSSRHIG